MTHQTYHFARHLQFATPREPEDYFMFDRYCSPVNQFYIPVAAPKDAAVDDDPISASTSPQNTLPFVQLGSN